MKTKNVQTELLGKIEEGDNPVKKFLIICNYYDTGILMNDGEVKIESIPGVQKELVNDLHDWMRESRELLKPFRCTVGMLMVYAPSIGRIKTHNKHGFELAKRIKSLVGNDYKVYYSCINCELL